MRNILRAVIPVFILLGFATVQAQPGCPAVTTASNVTIPCGQTCTNLTASAFGGAVTSSYRVDSIAYAPPFPFNTGTPILVHTDDLWSSVIPLGFNFCFYGTKFTSAIVGSNGCISFNVANAGATNNWSIPTLGAPFTGETDMRNSIMAPWQDMDPTHAGNIYYNVGGAAPCRYLEVSWDNCPMYGDPSSVSTGYCTRVAHQTQMAVIYETSNAVEIYIQEKDVPCNNGANNPTYWNNGWAIEGIMDGTGTAATTVPGRNATIWPTTTTLTNDAYRFTPNGAPNYTITWFQGGNQIGTGSPIQVCPTVATTYTASATYTNCDQSTITVTSNVFVGLGSLTASASAVQPTCNGSTNGSVTATFNSNSTIISYGWSPGGAGQSTLNNIGAGTYTFTISDVNGCKDTLTEVLTNPAPVVVTVPNDTARSCSGSTNNGILTATTTGGTAGYTYLWTGGLTTNPLTGLNVGTYHVTATDAHGCTGTATANVSVITSALSFASPQITQVLCFGGATGQIIDPLNGGTNPVTYTWSGGGTAHGDTLSNLAAGTYGLTAQDANGCSATASFTVTQPASAVTASVPNDTVTSCSGQTNIGTLTVAANGGTPGYTYLWSNGATTATISGLSSGSFTVTVTDASGCTAIATGSVVVKSSSPSISGNVLNPICFGLKGEIIVTVTGAVPPIIYSWNNGSVDTTGLIDTLTGVGGGTYSVTVTDANGCSASASFTVSQPTPLVVTVANDTVTGCSGNTTTGSLTATSTGGTPGYTYNWSGSLTGNPITGLSAGTYFVTVNDNGGCSATGSGSVVVVTNPVTFNNPQITNASCSGIANGQIILSTTGGTAPITFTWSGGTTQNDTLRNLAGGTYNITATDVNGCSATASYTINQSSPIVFGTPTITNIGCSGGATGSISVTATGGSGTITYLWSNGATTATITGLIANPYVVTATDANGCTASAVYTVTQASPIAIGPATVDGVTCSGNGSISVTATGGSGTLTYNWTGGLSGNNLINLSAGGYTLTVSDASGCSATAYYIVGHASCGGCPAVNTNNNVAIPCSQTCTNLIATAFSAAQTTTYTVGPIPYAPAFRFDSGTAVLVHTDDLWSGIITIPFNFCFWGVAHNKIVIGSNGEISFNTGNANGVNNWSIPGPVPFTNPNTEADQKNTIMAPWQDLDPTHHGNIYYNITGTAPCRKFEVSWYDSPMFGDSGSVDPNYCDSTDHQTQMVVLYETTNAIDIFIQNKDVVCDDLSNGVYWNNGLAIEGIVNPTGTNAITVPGRNATQWSAHNDAYRFTPAGAPNFTIQWFQNGNLVGSGDTLNVCPDSATTYSVFATYTNCDNSQVIVGDSVYVTPGGNLTVNVDSIHNIICNNDSSGAVYASYHDTLGTVTSFGWTPGGANQTSLVNIPAGTYIFTVTTSTGCSKSDTVVLTNPVAVVASVPNDTFNSCVLNNLGTLTATVSGGTPGYTYSWSNGATTTTISGLTPGTYTFTATDSHGCSATATATVTKIAGTLAITAPQTTNPGCITLGTIIAGVTGGTAPITYTWSPSEPNSDTITNLPSGTYAVTAVDAGGCSVTASYTLAPPVPVSIDSAHVVNVTCNGYANGSVTVFASGGVAPLGYAWAPGNFGNTNSITGLSVGTYSVTITDSVGCTATASYTVTQPSGIGLDSLLIIDVTCQAQGSIFVIDTGGVAPLNYLWSGGQTVDSITNQPAGTYGLTVTDANGCSVTASYTIGIAPGGVVLNAPVIINTTCNGDSTGSITANATGGQGTITYIWSTTATTATISNLPAGTYSVTASDTTGCSASATYTITQPTPVTFGNTTIDSIKCNGGTGGITVVATGGTGTITYSWTGGLTGASVTGLVAGTYCVTASDSVGCSVSACYTLTQPTPLNIDSNHVTGATCVVGGSVVVYVSGGVPGYSYTWSQGTSSTDSVGGLNNGGVVNVTITDANGCTITATYTVPVLANTVSIDSAQVVNVTCNGGSNGSVTVFASGGVGTLKYAWTPGGATTSAITGLTVGTYNVTVTDSLGCSATAAYTVTQPNAITTTVTTTQVTCTALGSILVTTTGGTGSYTYTWQGSNYTGDSLGGLSAGTYGITVTDSVGCSVTTSGTVTTAPNNITIATSNTQPLCNGNSNGSITATPSGGAGPYTYLWSPGGQTTATITGLTAGIYCVTVHDANGCSQNVCDTLIQPATLIINNFVTVNATCNAPGSAQVIAAGGTPTYTYNWGNSTANPITGLVGGQIVNVTVTDANGCTVTGADTLAAAPAPLTIIDSTIVNVICHGNSTGSISITVVGGVVGQTTIFHWSNGASTSAISNLAAGTYYVTASDAGGCQLVDSFKITQPVAYVVTETVASLVCPGNCDTATVSVTPANDFTYTWSNGQITQTAIFCNLTTTAITASVTVTDPNQCTASASKAIASAAQIVATPVVTNHPCAGGGDVVITATGGAGNLTYSYTPSGSSNGTGIFNGVAPGTYTYTVADALGCSVNGPFTILPAVPADVDTVTTDSASCFGFSDGSLTVIEIDSNVNSPFTYSINGGAFGNSNVFNNLAAGTYQIVVNNSAGCSDTLSGTVGQPVQPTVVFDPDSVIGVANNATPLNPTITNFENPVYSWTPATGLSCTNCANPSATVSAPTLYYVTVSDSGNSKCAVTDSIWFILQGPLIMPSAFSPNGDGKNDLFGPISHTYVVVKEFHIYNRWGQLVHNSTDYWDGKFDGKEQPSGTYMYYIEGTYFDPATNTTQTGKEEGAVTLLR